ncbi:1133_t:CDS:2, partial [Cetraspora pellucida]
TKTPQSYQPTQTSNQSNSPTQSSSNSVTNLVSEGYSIYKTLLIIAAPIILLVVGGIFFWFYFKGRGNAKDRNASMPEGVETTYT